MTSCYGVRNHSEVHMIKLYAKLSIESRNVIYDADNADGTYNNVIDIVSTLYNECCPYWNEQQRNHLADHG